VDETVKKAMDGLKGAYETAQEAKAAKESADAQKREDATQKAADLRADIEQIESDIAVTESDLEHCKKADRTWLKGSLLVKDSIRADEATLKKLRVRLERKTKELNALGD
jgi:chromosome segregation ATPase